MFRRRKGNAQPANSYPNDVNVFEPTKQLGIFTLQMVSGGSDAAKMYQRAGVVSDADKPFIDLNVRKDPTHQKVSPESIRSSLCQVAEYVKAHPNDIALQSLIGLTYSRMGRVAGHFGFKVEPVDAGRLPIGVVQKVESYDSSVRALDPRRAQEEMQAYRTGGVDFAVAEGHNLSRIVAVRMSTDELVSQFSAPQELAPHNSYEYCQTA